MIGVLSNLFSKIKKIAKMNLKSTIFGLSILLAGFSTSCRYDNNACQDDYCDRNNPKRALVFDDTLDTEPHMLEFKYNAQGKVIQRESYEMPKRVLIYRLVSEYNASGQLVQEKRFGESGQGSATARPPFVFVGNTTYEYENGLLKTDRTFNLDREQKNYRTYTYDSQNRLKTLWTFLDTSTKPNRGESYDYDSTGNVILQKQLSGDSSVTSSLKKMYGGNLLIKTQTLDKQNNPFWENDFIYDGLGNLLETLSNKQVSTRMTYCSCNLTQEIIFHPTMGGLWTVTRYEY
jgi:hypothetical protein